MPRVFCVPRELLHVVRLCCVIAFHHGCLDIRVLLLGGGRPVDAGFDRDTGQASSIERLNEGGVI